MTIHYMLKSHQLGPTGYCTDKAMIINSMKRLSIVLALAVALLSCGGASFAPVKGFDDDTNSALKRFLVDTSKDPGRKVAVFDGDGTVFGQVPHYLADECLYRVALEHPKKKPEVIARMVRLSNVSLPYVQDRVRFFEGDTAESLRDLGDRCFREHYAGKIYPPMRDLVRLLGRNGFEVWVVTASPELMYQPFLSRELGIPAVRVIGVKSVIHGGIITGEMVKPVPQDHGKKEAIETFVQERPLLVAGNSRGDREMIEYSRGLRMIVNPDEFVAPDQEESIADHARRSGWLIVRVPDVVPEGFPSVSSKRFGIRENRETK